jgi:hypothetical protein
MANITREHDLSPSWSLVIMWRSRPLLTVSTANRLALHSAEAVHFHHKQRKSSKELWTQPCDATVENMASYVVSSSLILVIHDNMINETNHIV